MQLFFSSIPLAVRYMIFSAFGFAVMGMCVKLVGQDGIPILEIVAARSLVSLILSYASIRQKRLAVFGCRKDLLIARGVVGALTLVCVYYSVTTLPLAEATVLQYLHPTFTAILAVIFLKERLHPSVIVCIILSSIGLIVIAQPAFLFGEAQQTFSYFSMGIALLGAFGSAVAYVLVRKLTETDDPAVIILYFPLIALPLSLILLGNDFVIPTWEQTVLLILVGVFTQMGQLGLTKAMQTETASKATAFSYLQIIFSAVLGWLVFSEIPVFWTWVGGGLIVIGALINMFSKKRVLNETAK